MPDYTEHARQISQLIQASRDKVRALSQHWPTDGAHREEVLRTILRERLPARFSVEKGFVVAPEGTSGQIDILIVDRDKPLVGRGAAGEVFATPDAVFAVIEVKSTLEGIAHYRGAFEQLAANAAMCEPHCWIGLFVMEGAKESSFFDGPDDTILAALADVARRTEKRIQAVSVGSSLFLRYWTNSSSEAGGVVAGPAWHSYFMLELAPAYFIGNLVAHLTSLPERYAAVWFPIPDGKETVRRWFTSIDGPPALFDEYRRSSEANGVRQPLGRAEKWKGSLSD